MKENQNIEWKEVWRDEYLRWICGFANADGGTLVIGKNDKGQAVGADKAGKLIEDLPNKIRDVLGVMADVKLLSEGGKDLVEIHVDPYPSPISYKGEYHYRSGSTNQMLKGAALDRFLMKKYGSTWDGAPLPHVGVRDLSPEAVSAFRKLAKQSRRLDESVLREPTLGLLEKLKLTEGSYLKRAAVLLFHADPEQHVTGAFVKIGYFRTESELLYHDEIHGDLFTQAQKTMEILLSKYLKAAISYHGIHRIESLPVPEEALREAVLNALIHRDYAVTSPIQIRVYSNRLAIWNPGELPPHWSLDKLLKQHSSQPFNPFVANAFFRAGEIEAWGRGIQRMLDACHAADAPAPKMRYEPGDLWVEFPFPKAYLDIIPAGGEGKTAGKTPVETTRITKGEMSGEMSGKMSGKIVRMILENSHITVPEMARRLKRTERTIERQINKLKAAGIIGRVGPDKGGYWEVQK
jgi:ATP-dependent DNA helicase RecG